MQGSISFSLEPHMQIQDDVLYFCILIRAVLQICNTTCEHLSCRHQRHKISLQLHMQIQVQQYMRNISLGGLSQNPLHDKSKRSIIKEGLAYQNPLLQPPIQTSRCQPCIFNFCKVAIKAYLQGLAAVCPPTEQLQKHSPVPLEPLQRRHLCAQL